MVDIADRETGADVDRPRGRARGAALVMFVAIVAYAVVGVLHTLIWEPLATVPGASLGEIYAEVERANESMGTPLVIAWGVGMFLAGVVVLMSARRQTARMLRVLRLGLVVLVLAGLTFFYASFGAGMALGDTFGSPGGDDAPWVLVLYLISAVAVGSLVAVSVASRFSQSAP